MSLQNLAESNLYFFSVNAVAKENRIIIIIILLISVSKVIDSGD